MWFQKYLCNGVEPVKIPIKKGTPLSPLLVFIYKRYSISHKLISKHDLMT